MDVLWAHTGAIGCIVFCTSMTYRNTSFDCVAKELHFSTLSFSLIVTASAHVRVYKYVAYFAIVIIAFWKILQIVII